MPEEASLAPEATQDTPIPEAPAQADTPTEQTQQPDNWQERYENLQPEYTRATQEAAQYRQLVEALQSDDAELRAEAARLLNLEFEEPEPEAPLDEVEELRGQVQQLQSAFQEQAQAFQTRAEQEAEAEFVTEQLDQLEAKESREFSDDDVEIIARLASVLRDDQGRPDVGSAFQRLSSWGGVEAQRLATSKRAAQVQSGSAATKELDFSDKNARRTAMAEIIAANSEG